MNVAIVGSGGIGLGSAAWLAHHGHHVTLWSPGGQGALALRASPLRSSGVLEAQVDVEVADSARAAANPPAVPLVPAASSTNPLAPEPPPDTTPTASSTTPTTPPRPR